MSPTKPGVFVLVRIPKAGSTSLSSMVRDSLPKARHFGMPYLAHADDGEPWGERLRDARSRVRRLLRNYGTPSVAKAWRHIDAHASDGDVVVGHIRYGDPVLPSFDLRYITLLREPLARALSHYNYSRLGYLNYNFVQRAYISGRIKAAGTHSFSGYLSYLDERGGIDANMMSAFALGGLQVADPLAFLKAHYFHFGVLEHLDLFAAQLGRKLGVPVEVRKMNVTARREAHGLSSTDRPVFERVFARDIALYEAVLAHVQAAAHA